ncbi:hypothetical protein ACJRO7_006783 [Eucalyptus globulus]|uniref:PGG domain-containing protein n=1 Tax=Eucalyptus globulus TaxID=34317 RepID=A0ABD3IMI1_EUCGL
MDPYLYEVTKTGDANEFISALEEVSESRKLALSLIFDQVTPSGNSLLHVAASSGKDEVIELILDHFPNTVTRKNSSEDTPLHVAIRDTRLNATRMLIPQGKDSEIIYWKNKDGESPLYLAAETGDMEILHLLLEASAQDTDYAIKIQGMSPVFAALQKNNVGMLDEIIDRLPKLLHVRDENEGTPLHAAASEGDDRAVELLLRECPCLALETDKDGSYPIHVACERNNFGAFVMLLHRTWPDPAEIKNNKGQNILHVAAKGGNYFAVLHVSKECSECRWKHTLHLASMYNHCGAMLCLTRDKRSDLNLLNSDKMTALDVAMESGRLSTEYPALLGRSILILEDVPRSKGRGIRSPREQSSGESKSSRVEWIRDQVDTLLLVATLVTTVTFAAGFTLPGGYNASSDPHPGMATMLHNGVFQFFVIANMVAMYSSILAVVVLLWGHVTDFYIAELAYRAAGPLLLTALTSMTLAFMAAVIVAVSKLTWLVLFVLLIALIFLMMLIMVLTALIFPSSKVFMRVVCHYYLVLAHPADRKSLGGKFFLVCCLVLCFPCLVYHYAFRPRHGRQENKHG